MFTSSTAPMQAYLPSEERWARTGKPRRAKGLARCGSNLERQQRRMSSVLDKASNNKTEWARGISRQHQKIQDSNNGSVRNSGAQLTWNSHTGSSQVTRTIGIVARFSSNSSGANLVYKQRRLQAYKFPTLMLLSYSWSPGSMVSVLLLILCSLPWKWQPLLLCRRASLHCFSPLHLDNLTSSVVARTRLTPYLLSLIESELRSVYDLAIYK